MKKNIKYLLLALFTSCFNINEDKAILYKFAEFQDRFRFFFQIDDNWIEAKFHKDNFYSIENKEIIEKINNYVITYRNGNFAFENSDFKNYPEQVNWIVETEPKTISLNKELLVSGNHLVEISFFPSPILYKNQDYYETKIKNVSSKKFKVLKFGGFQKNENGTYLLNTITNDFFSAQDFQNWYLDSEKLWINPKEIISDPINYGGAMNNWAYQVETESGDTLWISSIKE